MQRFASKAIGAALILISAVPGYAQNGKTLEDAVLTQLVNSVSGEIALQAIDGMWRQLNGWNSEGHAGAFRYLHLAAEESGLFSVRLISFPAQKPGWNARRAELWLLSPATRKLVDLGATPGALAVFSGSVHALSELIQLDEGVAQLAVNGSGFSGKVVLSSEPLARIVPELIWKRGAAGVLVWPGRHSPPQAGLPRLEMPLQADSSIDRGFAFALDAKTGAWLSDLLEISRKAESLGDASAQRSEKGLLVRVDIDTQLSQTGAKYSLTADIPGVNSRNEIVAITAELSDAGELPEYSTGGSAAVLEVARALSALINDGLLPPPRRTIRFWWASSDGAFDRAVAESPGLRDSLVAVVHIDNLVPAAQVPAGGIPLISLIRPPSSRPGFLEHIVGDAARTLNGIDEAINAATFPNRTRRFDDGPASLGDKVLFVERRYSPAGPNSLFSYEVPGLSAMAVSAGPSPLLTTAFTPSEVVHPLALQRTALLAATSIWTIANLGDSAIPELAAGMYAASLGRLAVALGAGFQSISELSGREQARAAFHRALLVLEEAVELETRRLGSLRALAGNADVLDILEGFESDLREDEKSLRNRLRSYYSEIHQQRAPGRQRLSGLAKAAASLVPSRVANLAAPAGGRNSVENELPARVVHEVLNLVDGQRSVYEIYRAVYADAILAQSGAAEAITLKAVHETIKSGVQQGLLHY